MEETKIKKLLKERAKRKVKMSMTLDKELFATIKELAKKHKVSTSAFIETILQVGLLDPYISDRKEKEVGSELY